MSRVIDAVLKLTDEFTAPLEKSLSAMGTFQKSTLKIGKDIEKFGKSISNVGLGITAGVTLPLAAFGKSAVSAAGTYDQSVRLIKSTMGDAKWSAADLAATMEEVAEASVFTLQETADATLAFARAGFDAKEAAEMIAPALNLAAGTATDISYVTSGMTAAMKTFSSEGLSATEVADIFATAQAQAATDTLQLFDAVSEVGPMFNQLGWSIKDVAVMTDMFGDAGISGSEGATAMKTSLMRLADKADVLKGMGAEIFDDQGNLKSMLEVQEQLHNAFGELENDQETLERLDEIFGKNQGSKMLSWLNFDPTKVKEYREALDECTGTAQTMADAMMNGLGGSIESLSSTFDVFKIKAGEIIGETVQPFINKITELLNCFLELDDAQQRNIIKWATYAAAIGPVIFVFGKAVSLFGTALTLITKIGIGAQKMGGLFKLAMAGITSPCAIAIVAIAAIGIAIAVIIRDIERFKRVARTMREKIAPQFERLREALGHFTETTAFGKMADLISNVLVFAFENLGNVISTALGGVADMIDGISTALDGVCKFIEGIIEGDWAKAWEGLKDVAVGAIEAIKGALTFQMSPLIGNIQTAEDILEGKSELTRSERTTTNSNGYGGGGRGRNAVGTSFWAGGLTSINERGGEIVDLPRGTRIYPHDESIAMARAEGGVKSTSITIPKLADQIIIREDVDIDRLGERIANQISAAMRNTGGYSYSGNMA